MITTPKRGRPALPPNKRADSKIQLRVTRRRKTAYMRHAARAGQTLASLICRVTDRETGYKEDL